ncbi:MAG TPA: hypothetical protein VMR37_07780 [Rhabdochlamydiaceae bacterium]|nr:hypothetical protein [Rhabdochlamydiaceae bacterium]
MSTIRTYWSGNRRIISDLLWCCVIALSLGCYDRLEHEKNPFTILPAEIWNILFSFLEGVLDIFFFFFFWSWNDHHIKSRQAKYVVRGLFYCLMFSLLKPLLTGVFFHINWMTLVLAIHGLIIWKYIKLMCRKKDEKSDLELEEQNRSAFREND